MKKVLIAGASGMVGSVVLEQCIKSAEISSIISLARKPQSPAHSKLTEVIHEDFTDLSAVLDQFNGVDLAFFCIGEYTGAVDDDLFKVITVDMAVEFGNCLKAGSPGSTLCLLSGQGADRSEKSRTSFARYKGMAENHLANLGLGSFLSFRPGYIYPVKKRKEPNMMYRISRGLYPLLKPIFPNAMITNEELGKAMVFGGLRLSGVQMIENKEIKSILTE